MSIQQCSDQTKANIYSAWSQGLPPLQVAQALRLVPLTVITEYVRLDDVARFNSSTSSK